MTHLKHLAVVLTAIAGFAVMQSPAQATPFGTLDIAQSGGGSVSVSATAITFSPTIFTGAGTSVTYSGGVLGSNVQGSILSLSGALPVDSFMTFSGTPLDFTLLGLGPGSSTTTCGTSTGDSCSVVTNSPFLLTVNGTGGTTVSLAAFGTVTDGVGAVSTWSGNFDATINSMSPSAIQSAIIMGGSVQNIPYGGDFTVTIGSAVPEPGTSSLLAIGLGLLGLALYKSRVKSRSQV
jgi:hypothetical protein